MKFGFVTSPRATPYLSKSIKSLRSTSTDERRADITIAPTYIDPSLNAEGANLVLPPLFPEQIPVDVNDAGAMYDLNARTKGLERNSVRLCGLLAEQTPKDGFFVQMQDDIEFCPQAVDRIFDVAEKIEPRQKIGAVSFYSPHHWLKYQNVSLAIYISRFYGDLCMLWRKECWHDFYSRRWRVEDKAQDLMIGDFFWPSGWHCKDMWVLLAHIPCLIQHTGVSSATGKMWDDGNQRTSPNYNAGHRAQDDGRTLDKVAMR